MKVQDLLDGLRQAMNGFSVTADQLDDWAKEAVLGGWSTQHVEAMRRHADILRRQAAELKRTIAKAEGR